MTGRRRFISSVWAVVLTSLGVAGISTPHLNGESKDETISAFKTAVNAARSSPQGTCDSIPFDDLREKCQSKRSSLQEYCKEKPRTCEGLETKPLSDKINGIEERLRTLKGSTSSNDDEKRKVQDEIDKLEKELDYTKKSRETDMSDAGIRIDNGRKCLDVRGDYQSVFKEAASKASDEHDSDIRDLRDELINYWDARQRAHDAETDKVKDAINYCEEVKSGNK
jgi:chromosome segregation ATPase